MSKTPFSNLTYHFRIYLYRFEILTEDMPLSKFSIWRFKLFNLYWYRTRLSYVGQKTAIKIKRFEKVIDLSWITDQEIGDRENSFDWDIFSFISYVNYGCLCK